MMILNQYKFDLDIDTYVFSQLDHDGKEIEKNRQVQNTSNTLTNFFSMTMTMTMTMTDDDECKCRIGLKPIESA